MRLSSIIWAVSLVAGAGVASADPIKVELLSSIGISSYENDIISKIQGNDPMITVNLTEVMSPSSTPTLSTLDDYSTVMVVGTNSFGDAAGLGTVLQQYLDQGHGIVIAAKTNQSDSCSGTLAYQLCGNFNLGNYWAIEPGNLLSGAATLGTFTQGSPLLTGGSSFNGGTASIRYSGSLGPGASLVASWSDGTPLIATRTFGSAVEVQLNFFPVSGAVTGGGGWTAGGDQLMVNAIKVAANQREDNDPPAVPEAQTYMLAGCGLTAMALILKRRASTRPQARTQR